MHILLESITVGFVLDAKTESNTCRGDRFCRLCPKEPNGLDAVGGTPTASTVSGFFAPRFFTSKTTDANRVF